MRTDLFDYPLPDELIAQVPLPRGESRLLVLHRTDGTIEHRRFSDLTEYLQAGDLLVVNDTRVTARRLRGTRSNGLPVELLLTRPVGDSCWECLARPARPLRPGARVEIRDELHGGIATATVVGETPDGGRIIDLGTAAARDALCSAGTTPLPPYIHSDLPRSDEKRYQTVYARYGGSAAAPTAGLHFTEPLIARITAQGAELVRVTLHVGVATFRPVRTDSIEDHEMHAEMADLTPATAERINTARGRIIAVGTTTVRTLESAAAHACRSRDSARVKPFRGETCLFITPGYQFRAVDALITNFHQPRSTLLMLVSAFATREMVMAAYREAIAQRYRFLSFGDAMLIV